MATIWWRYGYGFIRLGNPCDVENIFALKGMEGRKLNKGNFAPDKFGRSIHVTTGELLGGCALGYGLEVSRNITMGMIEMITSIELWRQHWLGVKFWLGVLDEWDVTQTCRYDKNKPFMTKIGYEELLGARSHNMSWTPVPDVACLYQLLIKRVHSII